VTVEVRKRHTYVRSERSEAKPSPMRTEVSSVVHARMEAAKRALQEEAKRRQQEIGEQLRAEQETREKEEVRRKVGPPPVRPIKSEAEPEGQAAEFPETEADRKLTEPSEGIEAAPVTAEEGTLQQGAPAVFPQRRLR